MKEINVNQITEAIASMAADIACIYDPAVFSAIQKASSNERDEKSKTVMDMLLKNAEIAQKERIPLCQDTGLMIVWLHVGQDVHFVGGNINEAVNEGVRKGYTENYLRASSVDDPLYDRKNTKDNTPAILYTDFIEGDHVEIEVMAKGFGSENKSALKMLTPADGEEGVKKFVL